MDHRSWELGFHLRSPRAWLNDPNGCCQFRGRYLVYYQYNPYWPELDQKAWGLFSSPDLVHWRYEGVPIEPSLPEDRNGAYSGCSFVEHGAASDGGDLLHVFYTGNVICPAPDHDPQDRRLVYHGREANEITCSSEDGIHFGEKAVVLRTADYPDVCSRHVRDPKVWREDGTLHMLLGARHIDGRGMCLLYDSDDGLAWRFRQFVESDYPFGYMWECPNLVQLADGHEFLAFSPQGLPRAYDRWHNLWQAGYIPLSNRLLDTSVVDERDFVEWDHGHDFYAPQTFEDESGRSILIGWLGGFDPHTTSAPDGLDWCHCLTVPRLLERDDETGLLLQTPVPELEQLRGTCGELARTDETTVAGRHADILIEGIHGEGSLILDDSLEIWFKEGRFGVRYLVEKHAGGRSERSISLDELRSLRVLVDGSVVEAYVNGGRHVFSSRWFCEELCELAVVATFAFEMGRIWTMEDVLSDMYATSEAPDLAFGGRIR